MDCLSVAIQAAAGVLPFALCAAAPRPVCSPEAQDHSRPAPEDRCGAGVSSGMQGVACQGMTPAGCNQRFEQDAGNAAESPEGLQSMLTG
ncbi:MAG: hypothetical protein PVG72_03230 [Gammaproteobacteria bacterium]